MKVFTAWKMSVFGVVMVGIFLQSDWIRRDTPYSVQMRENADQNNSKYRHFLRVLHWFNPGTLPFYSTKDWSKHAPKIFIKWKLYLSSFNKWKHHSITHESLIFLLVPTFFISINLTLNFHFIFTFYNYK